MLTIKIEIVDEDGKVLERREMKDELLQGPMTYWYKGDSSSYAVRCWRVNHDSGDPR